MPNATVPDLVVGLSPFLVAFLSGWIGQANFPAWANAGIAGGVIIMISLLCVFVGGATFTNNLGEDFILVASYLTALTYGPLRPLQKYLILGPVSQLPAVRQEVAPSPAPPSVPSVPPRSS